MSSETLEQDLLLAVLAIHTEQKAMKSLINEVKFVDCRISTISSETLEQNLLLAVLAIHTEQKATESLIDELRIVDSRTSTISSESKEQQPRGILFLTVT